MKTCFITPMPSKDHGFALVIALSLMAFVMLLVLSMSTLITVESKNSQHMIHKVKAEQNALLGAMLALGRLQESAGPDQRVTARAEILDDTPADLSVDNINHPLWTGVWKTYDSDNPVSQLEGGLRNWSYVDEDAQWLVSQPPAQATVDPATTAQNDGVLLAQDIRGNDGSLLSVYAPLVEFDNASSAFAYWVSDEGGKAEIRHQNPYTNTDPSDTLENQLNFLSPRRTAPELNAEVSQIFDPPSTSIEKVSHFNDLSAFVSELSLGSTLYDTLTEFSQDYTVNSYGVIADVKNGGLRKDLTRGLDDQFVARLGMQSSIADNLLYEDVSNSVYGPNWDVLAAHYQMYKPRVPMIAQVMGSSFDGYVDTSSNGPRGIQDGADLIPTIDPRYAGVNRSIHYSYNAESGYFRNSPQLRSGQSGVAVQKHIMPIVLNARQDLGLESYTFTDGTGVDKTGLKLRLYPTMSLWNPYNTTLSAQRYLVRWKSWTNTAAAIEFIDGSGNDLGMLSILMDKSFGASQGILWYKTEPIELAPGEVRVFTLSADDSGISFVNESNVVSTVKTSADAYYTLDAVNSTQLATSWNGVSGSWGGIENPSNDIEVKFSYRYGHQLSQLNSRMRTAAVWFSSQDINGYPIQPNLGAEPIGYLSNGFEVALDNNLELDLGLLGNLDTKISGSILRTNALGTSEVPALSQLNLRRSHDKPREQASLPPLPPYLIDNLYEIQTGLSSDLDVEHVDGRGYWGDSVSSIGQQSAVLYDIPRLPLQSLGALMHADGGYDDWAPNYVIGGSLASPFIPRDARVANPSYVDLSHYANEALFDSYFFSTVPSNNRDVTHTAPFNEVFDQSYLNDRKPLPNASMIPIATDGSVPLLSDLQDFDTASENLLIKGAFNVNSTSIPAWQAVLGSLRGQAMTVHSLENDGIATVSASAIQNPFPRLSAPLGTTNTNWTGFKSLTDVEITDLATAIVEQVKLRGPFLSLGDFVNRRLSDTALGLKGALQAAIDNTSINSSLKNDALDSTIFPHPENLVSGNGVNQPTWLSQNDLLATLAPKLSARSDTFIIRSYGHSTDSIGSKQASAWCEIEVQRSTAFIDEQANAPSDDPATWSALNSQFGRRYHITSIRWIDDPALN